MHNTIITLTAFAAVIGAQTVSTSSAPSVAPSSTQSQAMPPAATAAFNIANVTASEKANWCLGQIHTCPQICGGSASTNACNSDDLTYTCVCANGTVPDCTPFKETLPFYICQATFGQCIASHPNDAVGQKTCQDNDQCGTRNATAEALGSAAASSSTTASTTGSSTSGSSGSATAASSSASSSSSAGAGVAVAANNNVATGAFAAILMAAFRLWL